MRIGRFQIECVNFFSNNVVNISSIMIGINIILLILGKNGHNFFKILTIQVIKNAQGAAGDGVF